MFDIVELFDSSKFNIRCFVIFIHLHFTVCIFVSILPYISQFVYVCPFYHTGSFTMQLAFSLFIFVFIRFCFLFYHITFRNGRFIDRTW